MCLISTKLENRKTKITLFIYGEVKLFESYSQVSSIVFLLISHELLPLLKQDDQFVWQNTSTSETEAERRH